MSGIHTRLLHIPVDDAWLDGDLRLPVRAAGVVVFAHGSGSSRASVRNRFVAERLNDNGLGTVLFDLLTPDEGNADLMTAQLRFNIPFLGERLENVTTWLHAQAELRNLRMGYFGASTGAAAALVAAARLPELVFAIVSRGGRPDLAAEALPDVRAPTLLLVGSRDQEVLRLNERARTQLKPRTDLVVVRGATHLFEEPGTLEQVADQAARWFVRYLRPHHEARVAP